MANLMDLTETPQRRESDRLETQSDHDLLIQHTVKIDTLCAVTQKISKKLDEIENGMNTNQTEIYEMIINESHSSVNDRTFRWIIGFLIVVLLSIATAVGVNQVSISKNSGSIFQNKKDIDENKKQVIDEIERLDHYFNNF